MYDIYLKNIKIEKLRHLRDVRIPISQDRKANLIITGKNGSGKTSLLRAISAQLNYLTTEGDFEELKHNIEVLENNKKSLEKNNASENEIAKNDEYLQRFLKQYVNATCGIELDFSVSETGVKTHFIEGDFIVAFYEANRKFDVPSPKHVEKIVLKNNYSIKESPRSEFIKYILDLKVTEALLKNSGKTEKADKIGQWFDNFENVLKKIFQDDTTELRFDEDSFKFSIKQRGREEFSFQELSDGYAAILDIVVDMMVRMENHTNGSFDFDMPGIVLIDEIETHLHIELQKNIFYLLTTFFPNVQFIITTHSPFIISGAEDATLYDLENQTLVRDGLTNLSYDGIVTGYFNADNLSRELRNKFERYKELVSKQKLSDEEMDEITKLEFYLDEIPDYLELGITTEYIRLKTEFENREDL